MKPQGAARPRRSNLKTRLQTLASLQPKATPADLEGGGPLDLIALAVKSGATICRVPGTDRILTLRASVRLDLVPGRIITVNPRKSWICSGHPYLSGGMVACRLEPAALGLMPLKLEDWGTWDPEEQDWLAGDQEVEPWARPILARGPRLDCELEACVPGSDPEDFDSDPIHDAVHLRNVGDPVGAIGLLMALCQADLRCLDAHAHLGTFAFDTWPAMALLHYEAGLRIGQLSLGPAFDGLLRWSVLENRPFLRCMHGYGLCLWRMGRFKEAAEVFTQMLWLNPMDNQGARFLLGPVGEGRTWKDLQANEE